MQPGKDGMKPRAQASVLQIRRITRMALVWWKEAGYTERLAIPGDEKKFVEKAEKRAVERAEAETKPKRSREAKAEQEAAGTSETEPTGAPADEQAAAQTTEAWTMKGVKIGDRVRLTAMPKDPDPIPAGSEGLVVDITDGDFPQIEVWWDCGRTLFLLPDVDSFEIIGRKE